MKMRRVRIGVAGVLFLALLIASSASAIVVFDNQAGLESNQFGPQWTLGNEFLVLSAGQVTGIGVFDDNGDGFGGSTIPVAIYQFSGGVWNKVAGTETSFTGVDGTLVGQSRFQTLGTPVILTPGTYSIVACTVDNYNSGTAGAPLYDFNDAGGMLAKVGGSYLGQYAAGVTLPADGWSGGNSAALYFGAGTFDFSPVPEPSQFASAAAALLGLFSLGRGFWMRRRQQVAVA